MKQYMPLKPTKRGFKVWVRADAVTGYFCDFDVYVGKPSDGGSTDAGLGERVVRQLCRPLQGGNYQVFATTFFPLLHFLMASCSKTSMHAEQHVSIDVDFQKH